MIRGRNFVISLSRHRQHRRFLSNKPCLSGMDDEYGEMTITGSNYQLPTFELEFGDKLQNVNVNYATYGKLNEEKNNVLMICHALTGNSAVDTWWGSLLGPGKALDTTKYFIVCANILGSCYGTTGPASFNEYTKSIYGPNFPEITVRDTVKLHKRLLQDKLGINKVRSVIGGSLGGMQALEWAFFGSEFVESVIPIACGSHHSAWQIGIGELQRQAIYMDPLYQEGYYDSKNKPTMGLALARQIAMVSYRTHTAYHEKYGRRKNSNREFDVQSYLRYQGEKFLSRFDVNSYVCLTNLMDTHDVGRDRNGITEALHSLNQNMLVVGVDSDVLYPISQQEELAEQIPNASLVIVNSIHGHDGFLLEQEQINRAVTDFLDSLV